MPEETKSCLLITYGPVPTPQYQTVEGGGMRVWGLAKGLKANGVDVVVGVHHSFPQEIKEYEGVRLINWDFDENFAQLINSYDAVVMSYCLGDPSDFVVDHINDKVQLVLDAYVPIYVEVSARESKDIDTEYRTYMADVIRFNRVLRRGDYFLSASETQKTFYIGVLSALGIINPRSYRQDRILVAPFGIHDTPANATRNPYLDLGIKKSDFVALWFGGLYPWFRIEELLGTMLELSSNKSYKFVIVGGKNPFNPNPDFFKQYEKALAFAKQHGLLGKSVYFVDWVDFDDRINWYKHAGLVISLNQPGPESGFAWRTRVMDYVWGELAILTNGGDPLSEDLIAEKAAIRLKELHTKDLTESLKDLLKNPSKLTDIKKQVVRLKPKYYWQNIMSPVARLVVQGKTPYSEELAFKQELNLANADPSQAALVNPPVPGRLGKAARLPVKVISYARSKGLRRSAKLALNIAKTQAKVRLSTNSQRRFVFISHPIDDTGAPLVLMQVIEEFANKYGRDRVLLITPGIVSQGQNRKLRELRITADKAALGLSFRFIRMQLGLRKNDFVLMNTAAIYDNYRDFIMLWLRTDRLKHAFWFIHEDRAQLPYVHKEFLDKQNLSQAHKLMVGDKLTVLTPSKRTQQEYIKLLDAENVHPINLHVDVDSKYKRQRKAKEYSTIDFLLSGNPSDGRKGQLLALSAFNLFVSDYYEKQPMQYRDFRLHLVSINDDYISQQVRWVSESLLGKRVVIYPSMSKEKALLVTAKCNAVICCSLNETFGLYVAEGMFMGHVVLRNNSAGVDEQLEVGVNGYFIDHTDIKQFAATIEKILNKSSLSDEKLQAMGLASQKMIGSYSRNTYLQQLINLDEA